MKQKPKLLEPKTPAGAWLVEIELGRAGQVSMRFPSAEMANAVYRELQGAGKYQGHWITGATVGPDRAEAQ
jgi:hypothetical protein